MKSKIYCIKFSNHTKRKFIPNYGISFSLMKSIAMYTVFRTDIDLIEIPLP